MGDSYQISLLSIIFKSETALLLTEEGKSSALGLIVSRQGLSFSWLLRPPSSGGLSSPSWLLGKLRDFLQWFRKFTPWATEGISEGFSSIVASCAPPFPISRTDTHFFFSLWHWPLVWSLGLQKKSRRKKKKNTATSFRDQEEKNRNLWDFFLPVCL